MLHLTPVRGRKTVNNVNDLQTATILLKRCRKECCSNQEVLILWLKPVKLRRNKLIGANKRVSQSPNYKKRMLLLWVYSSLNEACVRRRVHSVIPSRILCNSVTFGNPALLNKLKKNLFTAMLVSLNLKSHFKRLLCLYAVFLLQLERLSV